MLISVWRHQKNTAAFYWTSACIPTSWNFSRRRAQRAQRACTKRRVSTHGWRHRADILIPNLRAGKGLPAEFEATADDASYTTILFKNEIAQYTEDHAARGEACGRASTAAWAQWICRNHSGHRINFTASEETIDVAPTRYSTDFY